MCLIVGKLEELTIEQERMSEGECVGFVCKFPMIRKWDLDLGI